MPKMAFQAASVDKLDIGHIVVGADVQVTLDALSSQHFDGKISALNPFAEGFEGIIGRVWSNCRRVMAAGAGPFSLYTRKLAHYCGDIPLNNGYLAASEAMIGRAMGEGVDEYALLTDNASFERTAPDQIKPVRSLDTEEKRRIFTTLTIDEGGFRLGDDV